MNSLDLVIVLAAVAALIAGYRLGLLTRVLAWGGLLGVLTLAAIHMANLLEWAGDPDGPDRTAWMAGILFLAALCGKGLGAGVGRWVHRRVLGPPLRRADRLAGAGVGMGGVAVLVWLVAPLMAAAPGWPREQAAASKFARLSLQRLPGPPAPIRAAERLLQNAEGAGGPFTAASLGSGALLRVTPPADTPFSAEQTRRVQRSIVMVRADACDEEERGSGFVVGQGRVVTNAHVVAGARTVHLTDAEGLVHHARVLAFDRRRDLALLGSDTSGPALVYSSTRPGPDAEAAVFGHPDGGELRVAPASVRAAVVALGRDLYDREEVRRNVLVLAADLEPGDSGAPVVGTDGQLLGVSFAVAPDQPGTAFALSAAELTDFLAASSRGELPAHPGGCLLGR